MACNFEGQVVVVTGAGRGLGRIFAHDFARRGAAVVVNNDGATPVPDNELPVAAQVVKEIEAVGGRAVASHESVATPEGGEAIVRTAIDEFGRLDAVVVNAGVYGTDSFDRLASDEWQRVIHVNLDGAFYVSQPAFREMKSQGYGRFVFISSSIGLFGSVETAHYAASKAGLLGLANVIALEGVKHGILANCVLPMGATRLTDVDQAGRAFVDAQPPELVVPLVTFLASRDCDFTHQTYSACAGRYARAFVGLGEGWIAEPGTTPTAEDIAHHLSEIADVESYSIPRSIRDEIRDVCSRLGIA